MRQRCNHILVGWMLPTTADSLNRPLTTDRLFLQSAPSQLSYQHKLTSFRHGWSRKDLTNAVRNVVLLRKLQFRGIDPSLLKIALHVPHLNDGCL